MINTVTFDVWNTLLIHEFYDERMKFARMECIRSAMNKAGFDFSFKDMEKAYEHTENCLMELWSRERDLDLDGHLKLFLEGLGISRYDGYVEMIRKPYSQVLLRFSPGAIDGAEDLLRTLKSKGYRIGLISNTGRTPGITMRILLDRMGLSRYFDSMTFSNEVGYIKPNKKIFEMSLANFGISPQECVHVGDSMLLDVYGAKSCGMKTIHFTKYSAEFEKYAQKYYNAKGRHEDPDEVVGSLPEVSDAIRRLGGP
ncbi:HAD family hydrolase [Methanocella sp. CWC-04]|uniref:HAD family hydrolase n=1 Tax=Methanooceanicella nereidis TaxID=2052831 RepID=A0AAP2W8R7_9EURY|nr:HAD family hydrolase [Methanocella sp. CWC-04]MCD1296291.1 HAD family hydrolase [Methanocella sp. CWC-04]